MKTTLDLPDDLMREVKIRAVHEHPVRENTEAGEVAGRSLDDRRN
jgi:hypothetical protein